MKFTTILAASASIAAMLGAGVAQAQSLEELAAAATEEGNAYTKPRGTSRGGPGFRLSVGGCAYWQLSHCSRSIGSTGTA